MTADVAAPLACYAPFRVIFAGIVAADPARAIVIKEYADLPPDMRERVGEISEMHVLELLPTPDSMLEVNAIACIPEKKR